MIQAVKSSGLLLATYGDPKYVTHHASAPQTMILMGGCPLYSNEPENVRLQEEKGVDAVISDHFIIPRTLDA